jgi:hypothetical protein
MEKLSTENDEIIIQHLSEPELATISSTSRYYHAIAEPHLYKDVVLWNDVDVACFMLTVLKRKHLCQYVRSIILMHNMGYPLADRIHEEMLEKATEIKDLIQHVALPLDDDSFMSRWSADIFDQRNVLDGTVALLLSLATNLEYLGLGSWFDYIRRRVLLTPWRNLVDVQIKYPLCKLKELKIYDRDAYNRDIVLPSMTIVKVAEYFGSYTDDIFRTPYGFQNSFENVQVLEFRHMHFEPASIGGLVPHFRQLKQLRVCNTYQSMGPQRDFELLSRALVDQVPALEVFEWSGHKGEIGHPIRILPLGSLKGLTKLMELAVVIELFAGHDPINLPPHLTGPSEYLPGGLKTLRITRVPCAMLEKPFESHDQTTMMAFVVRTASSMCLSTLEISLVMDEIDWHDAFAMRPSELSQCIRDFIPKVVNLLAGKGITFRIWGQSYLFSPKLPYEPGFAARWPHWEYIEGKPLWNDD